MMGVMDLLELAPLHWPTTMTLATRAGVNAQTLSGTGEEPPFVLIPKPDRRRRGRTPVTSRDIARRAYSLYVMRGREDGHDLDDWLQAERELMALHR